MQKDVITQKSGIMLDIGCGANKQPGFVGMDMREMPGVDIVHRDKFPWPIDSDSVNTAMASHLIEHIPPFSIDPRLSGIANLLIAKGIVTTDEVAEFCGEFTDEPIFMRLMNEVWRVMKPECDFLISLPYGWSFGYIQDPTHANPCNEATWQYFDPRFHLWYIYKPRPWIIQRGFPVWNNNGNMEIVLKKPSVDQLEKINAAVERGEFYVADK